jgi:uncharacterized protein (DUF305 family)
MDPSYLRAPAFAITLATLAACSSTPAPSGTSQASMPSARIVQPGAPGAATRAFEAGELEALEGVEYTAADVHFMQGMIPHHAQALQMTALVRQRGYGSAVRTMALRMEISQRDEIGLMEGWLRDHGESVTMADMGMGMTGGLPMMPGMLTPEQMTNLAEASFAEFDALFLEYMIQHHQGAIMMVEELFNTSGAGQESLIFKFASDVGADQTMEIERMQRILDQGR